MIGDWAICHAETANEHLSVVGALAVIKHAGVLA
jgi:hypothetical protein